MPFKLLNRSKPSRDRVPQLTIFDRKALEIPGVPPGPLPYATYDQMQGDSMVQTVLTVKKLGVLAADWSLDPADSGSEAKRNADFVKEAFQRMEGSPATILAGAMDAFAKGWSIQEAIFTTGTADIPVGPPAAQYDVSGRVQSSDSGKPYPRAPRLSTTQRPTPNTQRPMIWLEAVRPKDPSLFGIEADEFGNIDQLLLRLPGQKDVLLPRQKFILWANRETYRRSKGRSDLDAAYPHWKAKQTLLAAWKLHLERFAMPTVLGQFQRGLPADEQAALAYQLRNLSHNVAIVYPSEITIDTLGGDKEQSQGFMDALDFHNREIARAVLGQTLTTDEGRRVGSLAMGKVHLQVLLVQLEALRKELADRVMTEQIIRPLIELNFGRTSPIPRFTFAPMPLDAFTTGNVS